MERRFFHLIDFSILSVTILIDSIIATKTKNIVHSQFSLKHVVAIKFKNDVSILL